LILPVGIGEVEEINYIEECKILNIIKESHDA